MKKGIKQILIFEILMASMLTAIPVMAEERPAIRELTRHPQNYADRSVTLFGEVGAVVERLDSGLYVTNLDQPQGLMTSSDAQINLYLITDPSESIYVVTTQYFEEKQRVEIKIQILITADETLDQKRVNLFDQHISKKFGISSLGYSRFTLQSLLKKIPKNRFWVLAVGVE